MSDTINKAIEALRASINYINESPCDPDITAMQIVAYDIYLKSNPEQVLADLKAWQAAQAQAPEPVAVADNGVLNWIDGKQFDHEADLYTQPAVNQQLLGALKQILGWRELRSGANEVPIGRIEDLAKAAIAAAQEQK